MEGTKHNFEAVLQDFEKNLQGALYAAVDMELTGISIEGVPDNYAESAAERMSKLCAVAENHAPIQIGFTLVKHENNCFQCFSYSFYAFPWSGPELPGRDRSFLCTASALQFNADNNRIDFNKWLKDGVPYMSREDEALYLASPSSQGDTEIDRKTGLLRLWKLLCDARLPLVTHCPLDIFFLLSCFEQRRLPRDPADLSRLLLRCLPCVFDTAHLHGAIGDFKRLKLVEFLDDARSRHAQLSSQEEALPCHFQLGEETAALYGGTSDLAHDAGFDSLCTAQLYAYLLHLSPQTVAQNSNRLFLYKSIDHLDLTRATNEGEIGCSLLQSDVEPLTVVRLRRPRDTQVLKAIAKAGFVYRRMDSCHVLITRHHSRNSDADLPIATALASKLDGIQCLTFAQWRSEVRSSLCSADPLHAPSPRSSTSSASSVCTAGLEAVADKDVQSLPHCSKAEAWLENAASDPRYHGVVKTFNLSSPSGYGFISSPETYAKYKLDVFVHRSQLPNPRIGQEVTFSVSLNARGQPQAKDIEAAWPPIHFGISTADIDEARTTTVGGNSDCASTFSSDLDNNDNSFSSQVAPHNLASLAWLGPEVA